MLSILIIQNLERTITGFELRSVLIIISCGLMDVEKGETDYRLHALPNAGISLHIPALWLWRRQLRLRIAS